MKKLSHKKWIEEFLKCAVGRPAAHFHSGYPYDKLSHENWLLEGFTACGFITREEDKVMLGNSRLMGALVPVYNVTPVWRYTEKGKELWNLANI